MVVNNDEKTSRAWQRRRLCLLAWFAASMLLATTPPGPPVAEFVLARSGEARRAGEQPQVLAKSSLYLVAQRSVLERAHLSILACQAIVPRDPLIKGQGNKKKTCPFVLRTWACKLILSREITFSYI